MLGRPSPMGGLDPGIERIFQAHHRAWLRSEIVAEDPGLPTTVDSLLGRLASLGMARDSALGTVGYQARWALTEFGTVCARYMQTLSEDE